MKKDANLEAHNIAKKALQEESNEIVRTYHQFLVINKNILSPTQKKKKSRYIELVFIAIQTTTITNPYGFGRTT